MVTQGGSGETQNRPLPAAAEPSGTSERGLLTRWLTGLSLVQSAEFLVQREADVAAAVALISADAASESLLGLIGSWSGLPHKDRPSRGDLIERATDALAKAGHALDPGLLVDLRSTHTLRNGVVHHGATATRTEAVRAVRVSRAILDLVPIVSARFSRIPLGGGLGSGVASVIATNDVATQLRAADAALAAGDAAAAMDAAGRALGRLWYFTKPSLEGERSKSERGRARAAYDDPGGRRVIEDIAAVRRRIDGLLPWIIGPAVGLQPAEYARLTGVVGWYTLYDTTPLRVDEIHRSGKPTAGEAQWATERVAQVVFRLWETGVLEPSDATIFADGFALRTPSESLGDSTADRPEEAGTPLGLADDAI